MVFILLAGPKGLEPSTSGLTGKKTGYLGSNKNNDGVAMLFDRYGDAGWLAEGKQ